jgi:hypothetical protein
MPKYIGNNRGNKLYPISRADIELAQKHTKSNSEAARFLGTGYARYKRYAKIYNLFDRHLNKEGFGIPKGFAAKSSSVKLADIFANKYPGYSLVRLKHRMVARNLILEECALCGFKEKRITDSKTPLLLTFKNGKKDFAMDNLHLLCYNCLFLTTGSPSVANRHYIEKSFKEPDKIPKLWQIDPRPADRLDPSDKDVEEVEGGFSDLHDEIMRELGRD